MPRSQLFYRFIDSDISLSKKGGQPTSCLLDNLFWVTILPWDSHYMFVA